HLVHPQVPVALLPDVEGRLTDAELATDIADGCARVRLPERIGHLLLRELRRFIRSPSCCPEDCRSGAYSSFGVPSISGEASGTTPSARRLATLAIVRRRADRRSGAVGGTGEHGTERHRSERDSISGST